MNSSALLLKPYLYKLKDWLVYALVLVFLFGVYGNYKIEVNGMVFPVVLCLLSAPLIMLLQFNSSMVVRYRFLFLYLYFAFLSVFISYGDSSFYADKLKGFVYLVISISFSYLIFRVLLSWDIKRIERLFTIILALLIVGLFLEVYTSFKAVSDQFREVVFASGMYGADEADLNIGGRVRPKLFTAEPSHVAKFALLCVLILFFIKEKKYVFQTLFLTFVLLFLTRSYIMLAVFPIVFASQIVVSKRVLSALLMLLLTIIALVIFIYTNLYLSERVASIASSNDGSIFIRLISPVYIAYEVFNLNPLFGVGISGTEVITDVISKVLSDYGVDTQRIEGKEHLMIYNAMWLHWIYFGVLGGIIQIAVMCLFLIDMKSRSILFFLFVILIISNLMGGINGMRFWFFFFMLLLPFVHKGRQWT